MKGYEKLISKIELSPSNRAKCEVCENTIEKGTPRGVSVVNAGRFMTKKYTCRVCIPKELDNIRAEFDKMNKNCGEENAK